MILRRCRKYGEPATEKTVDVTDSGESTAADYYVHEHVRHGAGDIVFVEVWEDSKWELWRVEVMALGPIVGMLTAQCTEEEMRREMEDF